MAEEMNGTVGTVAEGAQDTTGEGVATETDAGTAEVKATEQAQESASGAEFSDDSPSADGTEPPDGAQSDEGKAEEKTDKAEMSEGERAIHAMKRREFERKQELQKVREQTIIETLGGINPFTGEKMEDSADVEQYLTMREIKSRGGDPVGEFAKYHKIMEREKTQREAQEAQARTEEAERQAARDRDMSAHREKYPDVDVRSMMNDGDFMAYAKGRVGKDGSIYAVYDAYAAAKAAEDARVEQRAREMAAQMQANAKASPGTAKGEASTKVTRYTPEMVRAMSKEEIKANYDKICRDIKYWK